MTDSTLLEQARQRIREAGYGVSEGEGGLVKVEGYAPMTAEALVQFANGLRMTRRIC